MVGRSRRHGLPGNQNVVTAHAIRPRLARDSVSWAGSSKSTLGPTFDSYSKWTPGLARARADLLRLPGSGSPVQSRRWLSREEGATLGSFPRSQTTSQHEDRNEILSNHNRRSPLFRDGGRVQQDRTHGSAARPGSYYCCDPRTSRNSGYYSTGVYDSVHHSLILTGQLLRFDSVQGQAAPLRSLFVTHACRLEPAISP